MGAFEEKLWSKNQGEMSCQRKQGAGGTHTQAAEKKGQQGAQVERGSTESENTGNTYLKYKPEQATCPPRPPH